VECRQFQEHIYEYLDGDLPPQLAAGLAEHAETCRHCTELRDEELRLATRLRGLFSAAAAELELNVANTAKRVRLALKQEAVIHKTKPLAEEPAARFEKLHRKRKTHKKPAAAPTGTGGGWWAVTAIAASVLFLLGMLVAQQLDTLRPLAGGRAIEPKLARVGTVEAVQGDVYLLGRDGKNRARPGGPLLDGQKVLAEGSASSAKLRLGSRTMAVLAANTAATVTKAPDAAPRTVYVHHGRVAAEVVKGTDRAATFATAHAEVQVVGTRFTMAAKANDTEIELARGRLAVRNKTTDETVMLADGDRALVGQRTVVIAQASFGKPAPRRVDDGLLTLYTFNERHGSTVHDLARFGTPLHMRILDRAAVRWLPGGGLAVSRPTRIQSVRTGSKITHACKTSNALTVEAWVKPYNVPRKCMLRHVVTLKHPGANANFTIGMMHCKHHDWQYRARARATKMNHKSAGMLTASAARANQFVHLVYTYRAPHHDSFYIDAVPTTNRIKHEPGAMPRSLQQWHPGAFLAFANEVDGELPWLGEFHLVAVYGRALTPQEVRQNFKAGPMRSRADSARGPDNGRTSNSFARHTE